MILRELQTYLADRGRVSLAKLQQQFRSDPEVLRDMLRRLIRKGRVSVASAKACGGCSSCAPETLEFYEWRDRRSPDRESTACG